MAFTPKPMRPKGTPASSAGGAAKAPAPKRGKAVKVVTRNVLKSGGTRGEARGVIQNLRKGTNLTPKAQIKRSVRQAKAEGLGANRIRNMKNAERKIASKAAANRAGSAKGQPPSLRK